MRTAYQVREKQIDPALILAIKL